MVSHRAQIIKQTIKKTKRTQTNKVDSKINNKPERTTNKQQYVVIVVIVVIVVVIVVLIVLIVVAINCY